VQKRRQRRIQKLHQKSLQKVQKAAQAKAMQAEAIVHRNRPARNIIAVIMASVRAHGIITRVVTVHQNLLL
jgi:phage gp46-like protein